MNFLELAEVLRTKSRSELDFQQDNLFYHISYDSDLRDLLDIMQEEVVLLLTDTNVNVKIALMTEMPRLCVFFGRNRTCDVLLSHMITYLNDCDWELRISFCEAIVGVGTFVGSRTLEEFILPVMIQALTDTQEFVVEKILNSFTSLTEIGLVEKAKLKELAHLIIPLLMHPNHWIRVAAVGFVAVCAKILPQIDVKCVIYPLLSPFAQFKNPTLDEINILESLKPCISRQVYEHLIDFAFKNTHADPIHTTGYLERYDNNLCSILVSQLKEMGIDDDDKKNLYAMKHYISKSATFRMR